MTETSQETQKSVEINSFRDILLAMVGKVVTVVNPESYEDAPMGSRLTTGFYRAKVLVVGDDFISLATEFQHKKGDQAKEAVRQFVPLANVKRISVMKSDRLIHL